jgi:hypothetical protein
MRADANKNLKDWLSYGKKVYDTAQRLNIATPLLERYRELFEEIKK